MRMKTSQSGSKHWSSSFKSSCYNAAQCVFNPTQFSARITQRMWFAVEMKLTPLPKPSDDNRPVDVLWHTILTGETCKTQAWANQLPVNCFCCWTPNNNHHHRCRQKWIVEYTERKKRNRVDEGSSTRMIGYGCYVAGSGRSGMCQEDDDGGGEGMTAAKAIVGGSWQHQ